MPTIISYFGRGETKVIQTCRNLPAHVLEHYRESHIIRSYRGIVSPLEEGLSKKFGLVIEDAEEVDVPMPSEFRHLPSVFSLDIRKGSFPIQPDPKHYARIIAKRIAEYLTMDGTGTEELHCENMDIALQMSIPGTFYLDVRDQVKHPLYEARYSALCDITRSAFGLEKCEEKDLLTVLKGGIPKP